MANSVRPSNSGVPEPVQKFLAFLLALPSAAQAQPLLHPLFSDHAVLQRGQPIPVWGTASPGERVTVTLGTARRTATAGRDGRWQVELPAMEVGGPLTLTASGRGGSTSRAQDLLIGDVWLCSGQSNMEWPVRRALNGEAEVQNANDPQVRILTVPQRSALEPQKTLAGVRWELATPQTAADFSAACWFMVRDLRASEKVPIGAIDSSWGGTRIRPWMDEAAARRTGGQADAGLLAKYRADPAAAARLYGEQWGEWWRTATGSAAGTEPWRNSAALTWSPVPSIGYWEQWGVPEFANFNGSVWMRRRFTLTKDEAAGDATLLLGVVDDYDQTFVNGVGVGSNFGWALPREYRVPANLLRAGENKIIVYVGDSWGLGGLQGPAERLSLKLGGERSMPLGAGWEYSIVRGNPGDPPRAPWDGFAGLGTIYNGMIAPLGPFGFKGVAWYQGESDVNVPGYAARLGAMMQSWRSQFRNRELPFLVVSLANFGPPQTEPRASGWAELREQQRLAAARDRHAAIVIAMDHGERGDIHPPNKQPVGQRLARAARALAYGGREAASGPQIASARRTPDGVVLQFEGVTGRLRSWSGLNVNAFELCGPSQETCRFAMAVADGATVRVTEDGRPATRVRYAWSESPVVNLYDEANLPAGPFEIAIQ